MSPPPPPEKERINVRDLKAQIIKRIGPEQAERYFGYLGRLLSHKLSKPEFNKLCFLTLGNDNLPLHNQLIRSILKNAFQAKSPPPPPTNGFNTSPTLVPAPPQTGWPNGDFMPPSPRKSRSAVRKIKDRPSPLGPNGRLDVSPHQSLPPHDPEAGLMANGDLIPYDLKRPVHHQLGGPAEQPAKRPRLDLVEVTVAEDREEAEQQGIFNSSRGPLRAPLGIPSCPGRVSGSRRSLPLPTSSGFASNYEAGELCHTDLMRKQMEMLAQAQGVAGVTSDCANLLNLGLDAYLKGLIRSCVDLVGARLGHEPVKQQRVHKQQLPSKAVNGAWLGNHMHAQSSVGPSEGMPEPRSNYSISLQDFRVAMGLNPQQLGEDWPSLLEKICLSSFEE